MPWAGNSFFMRVIEPFPSIFPLGVKDNRCLPGIFWDLAKEREKSPAGHTNPAARFKGTFWLLSGKEAEIFQWLVILGAQLATSRRGLIFSKRMLSTSVKQTPLRHPKTAAPKIIRNLGKSWASVYIQHPKHWVRGNTYRWMWCESSYLILISLSAYKSLSSTDANGSYDLCIKLEHQPTKWWCEFI